MKGATLENVTNHWKRAGKGLHICNTNTENDNIARITKITNQGSDIGKYNKCWKKAGKGIRKYNKNTKNKNYSKNNKNNKSRERHLQI